MSSTTDRPTLRAFTYSKDHLTRLIRSCVRLPETTRQTIEEKQQLDHLDQYFRQMGARTIIAERGYTDRDYLEDYAAYYVRCLDRYRSRCCRLHFHRCALRTKDLDALAARAASDVTEKQFRDENCYLGFIVIKPLPRTFIGRTCLKPHPDVRHGALREHEVHLLGLDLHVRTLGFQEQDRTTSACATSALWSVLQKTADLFHHSFYTPAVITRHATQEIGGIERAFPSHGLTVLQLAGAIRRIGLEPEFFKPETRAHLQAMAYAYLRMGIPLLLVGSLFDASASPTRPYDPRDPAGVHGVAVTGLLAPSRGHPCRPYCEPDAAPGEPGTLFSHSRVDRVFVHDDQIGPFMSLSFDDASLPVQCPDKRMETEKFVMKSLWRGSDGGTGHVYFAPRSVIVPVYHKIRISVLPVIRRVIEYDKYVETRRGRGDSPLDCRLEWDVFLSTTNDLKRDIRRRSDLARGLRVGFLEESMPRFVWRAIGLCGERRVIELLYDATDIEQADFQLPQLIPYDSQVADWLVG